MPRPSRQARAAERERTVFVARDRHAEIGVLTRGPSAPDDPEAPVDSRWATSPVAVGEVLNHIYRVTGYIADGGMGEVYEGVNVNTDERVAIKVILPRLAKDPKVLAMFRKEARTLTRLTHRALVQYRVLAQEPASGVLYIVTEFVDGVRLDQVIGNLKPTQPELLSLTRRLAEGLQAAHELGAIHRDISPDNILLPHRRMAEAKIIDFGIAKDIDADPGVSDDAFAGKLSYAAPEQFGEFGRQIGPWTDVYSLGLVMLSLASGETVYMGTTLTEAIDRRRAAPDLSSLPSGLRRVFAKMLAADPKNRFRSMGEVVAALDAVDRAGKHRDPLILNVGRVLAGVTLVGLATAFLVNVARKAQPAAALTPAAQSNFDAKLAALPCTWLTDSLSTGPAGLHLRLAGAASDPSAAELQAMLALQTQGVRVGDVDGQGVRGLSPASCETLAAVSHFRAPASQGDWIQTPEVTIDPKPNRMCRKDRLDASSVVTLARPAAGDDLALFRLDETGGLMRVFSGLAQFRAMAASANNGQGYLFKDLGKKGVRVSLCEKGPGVRGAIAVRGRPPFDLGLKVLDPTPGSAYLAERFTTAAQTGGWRTQAAWYQVAGIAEAAPPAPRR